eukprot:475342-Pelagomonas_calceolata.AAC.1
MSDFRKKYTSVFPHDQFREVEKSITLDRVARKEQPPMQPDMCSCEHEISGAFRLSILQSVVVRLQTPQIETVRPQKKATGF